MNTQPEWVSIRDGAALVGRSFSTVQNAVNTGALPATRFTVNNNRSAWRIRVRDLVEWDRTLGQSWTAAPWEKAEWSLLSGRINHNA